VNQSPHVRSATRELDEIVALLERYLSPLNVQALLGRALRERNLSPDQFRRGDIRKINPNLQRGLGLFLSGTERMQALRELQELFQRATPRSGPYRLSIVSEDDISTARNEARRLCEEASAKGFTVQKISTIVSELARNIVSYAGEGTLEIHMLEEPNRVLIKAVDSGPGIPNLALVLSGQYRSRTGLGRGLLGTKRLADKFDIVTGSSGTAVTAEVTL
jgi:serine/threonine-protein kinase RsbT